MAFKFNPFTGNFDIVRAPSASGSSPWTLLNNTISASSNLTFDTIALTSFKHAEYIITYEDTVTNAVKSFHLGVVNDNGSLKDSVTHKKGSNIDVDVDADVNAGNFELNFTNNESNDVTISVAKITID